MSNRYKKIIIASKVEQVDIFPAISWPNILLIKDINVEIVSDKRGLKY